MENLCTQCTLVKNNRHCPIRRKGKNKDCPCTICLLKSICNVSCEPWEKIFYKAIV